MADNNNSDGPITRTAVKNPDGSVTYKSNWSSSTPGSSSSSKTSAPSRSSVTSKPATLVRQSAPSNPGTGNTLVRQVAKSTPPSMASGSREVTSIPPMKTSGRTDSDITASAKPKAVTPNAPETPNESRIRRFGAPGERTYGKGEEKEKYTSPSYGGSGGNSAGSTTCTTC